MKPICFVSLFPVPGPGTPESPSPGGYLGSPYCQLPVRHPYSHSINRQHQPGQFSQIPGLTFFPGKTMRIFSQLVINNLAALPFNNKLSSCPSHYHIMSKHSNSHPKLPHPTLILAFHAYTLSPCCGFGVKTRKELGTG